MKIGAISYQDFTGKKTNKFKAAAAAMAIAASPVAVQEADAQILYPNPYQTTINVPDCFVVGNLSNFDYNKSMKEVFNELDINHNGEISAKEVLRTEAKNWNRFNMIPYNSYQAQKTYNSFNIISSLYNDDNDYNSDDETINYKEYKEIMNDYIEARKLNNFMGLMYLFMKPYHNPMPPHHNHNYRPDYRPNHPHRH